MCMWGCGWVIGCGVGGFFFPKRMVRHIMHRFLLVLLDSAPMCAVLRDSAPGLCVRSSPAMQCTSVCVPCGSTHIWNPDPVNSVSVPVWRVRLSLPSRFESFPSDSIRSCNDIILCLESDPIVASFS